MSQKRLRLIIFAKKLKKISIFPTMRFCSNFTRMWSKYLSNNVQRDFRLPKSESVMATYKISHRKINFCTEFAIKTLPCYHCKYWQRKSKISSYIIWYLFGLHAGEIWSKSYGLKCTNCGACWQKTGFLKIVFDKCWRNFARRFCTLNNFEW